MNIFLSASGWLVWLYSQSPHWLQISLWLLVLTLLLLSLFIIVCVCVCVVFIVHTAGDNVPGRLGEAEPVEETQETKKAQPQKNIACRTNTP